MPPLLRQKSRADRVNVLADTAAKPREGEAFFTRLGHESVETTQIYTHVMAKPGLGVRSPLDTEGAAGVSLRQGFHRR